LTPPPYSNMMIEGSKDSDNSGNCLITEYSQPSISNFKQVTFSALIVCSAIQLKLGLELL